MLSTAVTAAGWIFTKLALADFSPHVFVAIRFGLAGLLLYLFCFRAVAALTGRQVLQAAGTGLVLSASFLTWILAINLTESVGTGAFIISLTVVVIPLINRVVFNDALSPLLLFALAPSIGGLALLAFDFNSGLVLSTDSLLFALSTLGFASHVVLTGRFAKQIPALPLTAIQLLLVGMLAAIASLSFGGESWQIGFSTSAWMWLLLSAFVATSLRFWLQTMALTHVHSNSAALIFLLEPIWTSVFGMIWLNERFGTQELVGCLLISSGLLIYRGPMLLKFIRARFGAASERS